MALASHVKSCILKDFANSDDQLVPTVYKRSKTFLNNIPPFELQNKAETKYVWLPVNNSSDCSVASWGVGNDIEAEKSLRGLNSNANSSALIRLTNLVDSRQLLSTSCWCQKRQWFCVCLEYGRYHKSAIKYIGIIYLWTLNELSMEFFH